MHILVNRENNALMIQGEDDEERGLLRDVVLGKAVIEKFPRLSPARKGPDGSYTCLIRLLFRHSDRNEHVPDNYIIISYPD